MRKQSRRKPSHHEMALIRLKMFNKKRLMKLAKEMLTLPPMEVKEESPIAKLDFKIL